MLRLFWDRNFAEQKLVSFHLRLGGHDESPNLPSYSVLIQQMAPGNNFADDCIRLRSRTLSGANSSASSSSGRVSVLFVSDLSQFLSCVRAESSSSRGLRFGSSRFSGPISLAISSIALLITLSVAATEFISDMPLHLPVNFKRCPTPDRFVLNLRAPLKPSLTERLLLVWRLRF